MLAKIQNGTFVYIKPILNIHNNKLGLKLSFYPPYYFKFKMAVAPNPK